MAAPWGTSPQTVEFHDFVNPFGEGTFGMVFRMVCKLTGLERTMKTVPKCPQPTVLSPGKLASARPHTHKGIRMCVNRFIP